MMSYRYNMNMISKYIKLSLLVIVTTVSMVSSMSATHVVGGELKYRHIQDDRYEITLTFRRDCILGAVDAQFDNPANVWIFNGNGNLKTNLGVNGRLKMNFNSSDTLNQIIESDCGFEGTQVCVHETVYREIVRLPNNPGENGYILAYQRCCRNATLENILEPLETGGTWSVEITPEAQALNTNNQSPDFVQWAPVYVCANEDVNFDHSAIDADGDSLVYKLCTPFTGATKEEPIPTSAPNPPYTPVSWKDPYDLNNLLGGIPLQIDSETGLLTGSPNFVGQFLVGICVEEYRDGVKIGEVRRDFQYNVRLCSDPPTALFEANEGNCDGPLVNFDNQSLGGTAYQWNFNFPSTETEFLSTEQQPIFEYAEPGVYDVQLIVTRGTDACSDTTIQQVAAIFSDIQVAFDTEILACNEDGSFLVRLIDKSEEVEDGFDIVETTWEITQNGNTEMYQGSIINLTVDPEDIIVDMQVSSETGCKKALIDTLLISDFEHVADFDFVLSGCSDAETATLSFGDISDDLNPYDSPIGYSWIVTEGTIETTFADSSFMYDVADTGVITVMLNVDFGGGCTATVSKEIFLEDVVPQASYSVNELGCEDGSTVTLTYVSTSESTSEDFGIASTAWTITSAGESYTSDTDSITVTLQKDSVISLNMIVEYENGCQDVINESFIPGPYATITFDAEPFKVCLGDTISFVTNPNSDFTYTWSPMEGLYFEDENDLSNPFVVGIEDITYAVTVSDGLCEVEATVMMEVLATDNLMITGDSITCDGAVLLTATGGIGEGEFEWSLTTDFTDIIHIGETYETSFDGKFQTYYARFTGESCNDPFAEYTVKRSDIFDVVFNGDPVRVCLGDTVPLLANPNPLLTYEWSPLDGIHFPTVGDGSSAQVIGISDAVYNVTISDDFCSIDTFINVVIADSQNFQILGDSIVCSDTIQLIGFGASGIGTYQWSLDPDFSDIIYEGDTLNTVLTDLSQEFYVQFTDNTCGELVLSYNVRKFVFDIEFAEQYNICPGDTLDYTVFNLGEGPLSWEWIQDPHVVANGNTNMPSIGVGLDETEPFMVVFIATSPTGCVFADSIEFIIMDNPEVDFNVSLSECGEYTICFEIDGDYNGFPSWDFGDPTTVDDISIDAAPCYTYSAAGTYDVTLSNLSPQCPFEDVIKTVTINDDITLDPLDNRVVCEGDVVTINASSSNFNISYVWCDINGDTLTVGDTYEQTVNETFELILKGEDPNGCFDMDTLTVSPFVFDIEDNVPEVFCSDESTSIDVFINGTQDGYSFNWGPEDCVISGGDTGSPILQTATAKEYSVTITFDSLGCETIKTYEVTTTSFEIELDAIDENGINTDTINKTEEVTIFVIDQEDGDSYEWSTGEINDTGEITVSPEETTTYSVTVTDEMGCTATDDITIFVRQPVCDETDVFLPSAFTPNGDGVNDVLFLRSNFIDEMELLIYNRWGEEIFYTNDQSIGWDGTYKGAMLAPDVYAYTLRVVCINQVEFAVRGNVSLMK